MSPPTLAIVTPDADDPVPADLRAVIDLFASELAKVAFPDVDAASLKRQADELRADAKAVARAELALAAATHALAERTGALAQSAARAVAYARIYAEAHPEREALAGALAALDSKPPPATGALHAPRRRGRPRRQSAELFAARPPTQPPELA